MGNTSFNISFIRVLRLKKEIIITSFSQNKSKVSLSQLNKLSKISAKIICKKTNFIHRYGVLHNNQHLLYWVKMRNQPQIKSTTTITTTSLSHHHPLSTILSYNSFLFFYGVY